MAKKYSTLLQPKAPVKPKPIKENKITFAKTLKSTYLFYIILTINLVIYNLTALYPTLDGPAHLYNAKLLTAFIEQNNFVATYYQINSLFIPNWLTHWLLAGLLYITNAILAHKIFIGIYLTANAVSFRFLVKQLNPKNIELSFFIFPLTFSFLFHLGFYNFSIAFPLFFTFIAYWIKTNNHLKIKHIPILFGVITAIYYTNSLVFLFSGFIAGLVILQNMYNQYPKIKYKIALFKGIALLLISMLPLILLYRFYNSVSFYPTAENYSKTQLLKWIIDGRSLIVFDYPGEEIITGSFFIITCILLVISFLKKPIHFTDKIQTYTVLGSPVIISLVLLLVIKSGSNAGMMSDRFLNLFFVLLIIYTITRASTYKLNTFLMVIVVILHIALQFKHLNANIRKLDIQAMETYNASNSISENSIILPVNFSDNWMHLHFSNYVGLKKPVIILENYEASVGWFPLTWTKTAMETKAVADSILEKPDTDTISNYQLIKYIMLLGDKIKLEQSEYSQLKNIIQANYVLKYQSEHNFISLYELQTNK